MLLCIIVSVTVSLVYGDVEDQMVNLAAGDPRVMGALFSGFRRDYLRSYATPQESRLRMRNFRTFVKKMAVINAERTDIKVGVTFFADLSEEEALQYYGGNVTYSADQEAEFEAGREDEPKESETRLEKRAGRSWKNYMGSVKYQSSCGSCWTFAATANIEGNAAIATGRKVVLSEQEMLDCSGSRNNCGGGFHGDALNFVKRYNHQAASSSYRYQNRKGRCMMKSYRSALPVRVTGVYAKRGDYALASALNYGPVSVAMDFREIMNRGYRGGIYQYSRCTGGTTHVVAVVGYADQYWEIRNSWGSRWGERGYMRFGRNVQDHCRISTYVYQIRVQKNGKEVEEIE